jgi:hypothetical protein
LPVQGFSKRYEPDNPSIGKRGEVSLCFKMDIREIMIENFFPQQICIIEKM